MHLNSLIFNSFFFFLSFCSSSSFRFLGVLWKARASRVGVLGVLGMLGKFEPHTLTTCWHSSRNWGRWGVVLRIILYILYNINLYRGMHGGSCAGCVSRLSASKPIFNFLNHSSSSEIICIISPPAFCCNGWCCRVRWVVKGRISRTRVQCVLCDWNIFL